MIKRQISLCIGISVCLSATLAKAQDVPKVELFGGYSFLHASPARTDGFVSNGWDASLVGNLNHWFGIETNFSDHYGTSAQNIAGLVPFPAEAPIPYATGFSFLFGPHFSYRTTSRITPFAHALFGGTRGEGTNLSIEVACGPVNIPCAVSRSQTAFSMAFGGGIDWRATQRISIRLIQADYQRVNFTGNPQNNVSLSAGIVFTFGGK